MSNIARWNIVAMSDAHGAYVSVDDYLADKQATRQAALAGAALVADQVEATARPGDGKDAAAEIGRRIRAMMDGR